MRLNERGTPQSGRSIFWLAVGFLSLLNPVDSIQDVVVQVNSVRWSQVVSERYLSISIDPLAIILAGKLGQGSVHMARGLSPLFVRIGGPNTENLRFGSAPSTINNISVSEEEWVSVNKFAQNAKIDIVLCLRAMGRTQSVWDSANALEIISASHKHGFTDIWQMGWDMSEMTGISGAELGRDIVRLKKILDAFPGYESAPILGPGLSCCMNHFQIRFIKDLLQESSSAVSALPLHMNLSGVSIDKICDTIGSTLIQMEDQIWSKDLLLRTTIPRKPIWISELDVNSGKFEDAMSWLVKLGCGAKFGVQVMMRQPHLLSLHTPTPDYWVSLLYKNLVGRFVFDSRLVSGNKTTTFIFSHCTRPTDDDSTVLASKWYYEKGGVTLFGVNSLAEGSKIMVRGLSVKEETAHVYLLTEDKHTSTNSNKLQPTHTMFNGQRLNLSPKGELPMLSPKVRKVSRGQGIPVPPNSIFFIVFPDVRVRMCMSNPFSNDEFQDLSKKLTTPHPHSHDEMIDSWEDSNNEGVYVSFSKRVPKVHKHHGSFQEDLKAKLIKDWYKVAGKLGIEKDFSDTQIENTKYNFYNDQSWLSRLADGVNKNQKETNVNIQEPVKLESKETEASRLEKYALLTSAIYGKENNASNLLKISNPDNDFDLYHNPYRFVRSLTSSDDVKSPPQQIHSDTSEINDETDKRNEDHPKFDASNDKVEDSSEKYKKMHEFVIDYMKKTGHDMNEGCNGLNDLKNGLKDVDIKVDGMAVKETPGNQQDSVETNSEETVKLVEGESVSHKPVSASTASSSRKKRSPESDDALTDSRVIARQRSFKSIPPGRPRQVYYNERNDGYPNITPLMPDDKKVSSLAGLKRNDMSRILNENIETGSAFEVTPEPEDGFDNDDINVTEDDGIHTIQVSPLDIIPSEAYIQDTTQPTYDMESWSDRNIMPDQEKYIEPRQIHESNTDIQNEPYDTAINGEDKLNYSTMNPTDSQDTIDYDSNQSEHEYNPYDPDIGSSIKETPRLRKLSEIIEQIKGRGLYRDSTYKTNKLEERIQKLEGIKSRVVEIKEKIKEELNKAREKLALNMEVMRAGGDYSRKEQPTKRNIYEVPDKLAGILEKLNYNYMSNIKPRDRYTRSASVLSDDEIDEILEHELTQSANEFYQEQLSHLLDEDFHDETEPNYHYLVPAVQGTRRILLNRKLFPAKIFNLVRGQHLDDYDSDDEPNHDYIDRSAAQELYRSKKLNNLNVMQQMRRDDYDEHFHDFGSLLEDHGYSEKLRKSRDYPSLRKHLRARERSPRSRLLGMENDEPIIIYPNEMIDNNRYRRSIESMNSGNDNSDSHERIAADITSNSISKRLSDQKVTKDELKLLVDNKFRYSKPSLRDLAREYTKLAEKIDPEKTLQPDKDSQSENGLSSELESETVKDSPFNGEVPSNNDEFFKSLNTLIPEHVNEMVNHVMEFNNDVENLYKKESFANGVMAIPSSGDSKSGNGSDSAQSNDEEYSEEYTEDWVNGAERVSPPLPKSPTAKPSSRSSSTTIGRFMDKLKHLIKFISEFRLSDYLKGRKKRRVHLA